MKRTAGLKIELYPARGDSSSQTGMVAERLETSTIGCE